MIDSGVDVTVIGLDMCEEEKVLFSAGQLSEMQHGSEMQRFAALAFSGLLDFRQKTQGVNNVNVCDAVAMADVIWSDFEASSIACSASCITDEGETYGEVIFYRSDMKYDTMPNLGEPNIKVVTRQNHDRFYERVNELISG